MREILTADKCCYFFSSSLKTKKSVPSAGTIFLLLDEYLLSRWAQVLRLLGYWPTLSACFVLFAHELVRRRSARTAAYQRRERRLSHKGIASAIAVSLTRSFSCSTTLQEEKCKIEGVEISLPEEVLLADLSAIFNLEVWNSLTEEERSKLRVRILILLSVALTECDDLY
jgi:hypothetical protein